MIRRVIAALMLLLAGTFATAQVPFPQTLPANTVYGRLGISAGPGQAIPFATLSSILFGSGSGIFGLKLSGDTNYTMVSTDRTVVVNASLTAPRTITLFAAAALTTGQQICIADAIGGVTFTNTLTIARAGADTINGATSYVLRSGFGGTCLISDGASKWTVAQPTANQIILNGATSGFTILRAPATGSPATFQLPGQNGSAGAQLITDGSGNTSWAANVAFFANPSTGNDSNDCRVAVAAGGSGPCLTIQRAINAAYGYDGRGSRVVVNLSAGTFTAGFSVVGWTTGANSSSSFVPGIEIAGAGAGSTTVNDTSGNCGTIIVSGSGSSAYIHDFTVTKTGGCGGSGSSLFVQENGYLALQNMTFGTAGAQQLHVEGNATIEIVGNYTISGNAAAHVGAETGGLYLNDAHQITCTGSPAFSVSTFFASTGKLVFLNGTTFSGCGTATGSKFLLQRMGILDGQGNTGFLATIPGNAVGQVDDTSRYFPQPLPTLGTCTSGTLSSDSTDWKMFVSFGVAPGASCAVNFAWIKGSPPICVANSSSATGGTPTVGTTGTAVTIAKTFNNGEAVFIICTARQFM